MEDHSGIIENNRWFFRLAGKGLLSMCREMDRETGPRRGPQDTNTLFYCVGKLFEEIGAGAPVEFRASVSVDTKAEATAVELPPGMERLECGDPVESDK